MKTNPTFVTDRAIPLIAELCQPHANVIQLENTAITPDNLKKADGLFVRTVTSVNRNLLEHSSVKFVGSMTAGIDHLDTHWLTQQHIHWAQAEGANALAVAQYVISCIAWLQSQHKLPSHNFAVGVIGVGHVGRSLAELLAVIGATTYLIDPPRSEREPTFHSEKLCALENADLISLHTPLITQGKHKTKHLIDADFLQRLKPSCILLNTARGEIIATAALLARPQLCVCLDVYENEPRIDRRLLQQALITTPHVAGYSRQAKERATWMVYKKACDFFGWSAKPLPLTPKPHLITLPNATCWQEVVLAAYTPLSDSSSLKSNPSHFTALRNNYIFREEFSCSTVIAPRLSTADKTILQQLGFTF